MKKLVILPFLFCFAQICIAQNARRTLIEEFTSSSSDLSAVSDPVINQFEGDAAGHFCIVKWYIPNGTPGGKNPFYNDYPLSSTRSYNYYGNDTVSRIFLNGTSHFDPYGLSLDALQARVAPTYSETSPFVLTVTGQVTGDSVIANVSVRLLDTTIDLTNLSIGVIITERYNQTQDINHIPFHTNIVRTVLPSLDPKTGEIRDALPFSIAMQGHTQKTFRFAAKLGSDWDRYGLISVGVIQNNITKEVLQCNWTVPEVAFTRPSESTFLFLNGTTPCEFTLFNKSDSDITIYPQLTHNAPSDWNLTLGGMQLPSFVLKAKTTTTGTFFSDNLVPFRESGEFILLLRVDPGLVVASISGTLIGNDSRDLIIKNWASSVYKSDPDIQAWKQFGLDAAICNEDAIGNLFNNNLNRFRTIYVERSNYGDSTALASISDYMSNGGRLIFNSNSVNKLFSASIYDSTVNKYAPAFLNIFHTIPLDISSLLWTKGNVVKGNVFSDTLAAPFLVSARPIEPLVPVDTHLTKPLVITQPNETVGVSVETYRGKIAYLTFPLSDIINGNTSSFMMSQILTWFQVPVKVNPAQQEDFGVTIYPNPVTSSLTLHYNLSSNERVILTMRDELGKEVHPIVQNESDSQLYIDCKALPSGSYYYQLLAGEKTAGGKIIVQH